MIEPNDCVRFLLKSLQAFGITGETQWQKFERGFPPGDNIGGQINLAHPAGPYRFRNFVVADRMTDEQVRLTTFNDSRRKAGGRGFDEALCSLMRSEERFNFAAQKLIAFAGRFDESSNVARILLQRGVKDFLNRL